MGIEYGNTLIESFENETEYMQKKEDERLMNVIDAFKMFSTSIDSLAEGLRNQRPNIVINIITTERIDAKQIKDIIEGSCS